MSRGDGRAFYVGIARCVAALASVLGRRVRFWRWDYAPRCRAGVGSGAAGALFTLGLHAALPRWRRLWGGGRTFCVGTARRVAALESALGQQVRFLRWDSTLRYRAGVGTGTAGAFFSHWDCASRCRAGVGSGAAGALFYVGTARRVAALPHRPRPRIARAPRAVSAHRLRGEQLQLAGHAVHVVLDHGAVLVRHARLEPVQRQLDLAR